MGSLRAPVIVRNMAAADREWEGLFLVDANSIDTRAPRPQLEAIGLKPRGQRVYESADGVRVAVDVTTCEIEIMGEIVGATIVYGEAGVEPSVGVTVLESAGLGVDPRNQSLIRRPGRL